ncbi:MAG: hypothetical protein Q9227_000290 [Pyrenula ochraceoflavens]
MNRPKHPIILAHGLLGFDELRVAGAFLPGIQYWRGVREAMETNGIKVVVATVPPSGSIEERAFELAKDINDGASGEKVNIVAGLDSRYLISHLKPKKFEVASLTTIARSPFADYVFHQIGGKQVYLTARVESVNDLSSDERVPQVYNALKRLQLGTGAFSQLTRQYMIKEFNPQTPDDPNVKYFSYGATFEPSVWSAFRVPHGIVAEQEGPNDGLVSVSSSRWGQYQGTLVDVSHLDLINWYVLVDVDAKQR